MKYFGYMPNDFINGEGVCVSLWTAGCPHKCPGCHNPEMWDKEAGRELPPDIRGKIIKAISENGVQRNFSVLGGEPLVDYNLAFVLDILKAVRTAYPNIKIFLWTGYTIEEINNRINQENELKEILSLIDILIEGRFVQEERNVSIPLKGSDNQRILHRGVDF